jgi:uncharacterized protein YfbU (UPF0304 family)
MADELDDELFRRLVLANQYEMLAHLSPDEADGYRDAARQLRDWWPIEGIFAVGWMTEMRQDPLTLEDKRFVGSVLDMFDALQRADEAGRIDAAERLSVEFLGFCGNEESKYLSYFRWLREQGSFSYVKLANPNDLNSHLPMADVYARMLAKWVELGTPRELDGTAASAILSERIHPSNRESG